MGHLSLVQALEAYENISEHMSIGLFLSALVVSLIASFVAAWLYRVFYESRGTGSQVYRAFPLLGLSITTLFVCIQVSIPLSLGLMGSLSIIRFRTPIKEPEEVGFIILVIAASIASATFNFAFLLVLYILAALSLVIARWARVHALLQRDGMLVLTLPAGSSASLDPIEKTLREKVRRHSVQSISDRDGTTNIQITFSGLLTDAMDLQKALKESASANSVTVFLDRPGGLG